MQSKPHLAFLLDIATEAVDVVDVMNDERVAGAGGVIQASDAALAR